LSGDDNIDYIKQSIGENKMKRYKFMDLLKEEIQKLKEESFPHKSKKATFEVRTFKEYLASQKGETSQYPDWFLVNKKNMEKQ
jgi:hypothetical protein